MTVLKAHVSDLDKFQLIILTRGTASTGRLFTLSFCSSTLWEAFVGCRLVIKALRAQQEGSLFTSYLVYLSGTF